MSLATPALCDFAARLLAQEADNGDAATVPTAVLVSGKLGRVISRLAGAAGFRSLLSRALALAQAEVPGLKSARVLPDGTLEGLEKREGTTDDDEMKRGGSILVAQLLGLLCAFIGERLTQQLVDEAWPAASLNDEVPCNTPKP